LHSEPVVEVLPDQSAPAEGKQQGHASDDRREDQGQGDEGSDEGATGQVGACEDPGERDSDEHRECGGTEGGDE
jgi:hypothetical protein